MSREDKAPVGVRGRLAVGAGPAVATLRGMPPKRRITSRGAQKLGERERAVGLDADDEAARWLQENDPEPPPAPPKSVGKSKELHRWRRRQAGGKR